MSIDRIIRKDGVRWRARVLLPNGKRPGKVFKRKVDAEQWGARFKSEGLNSSELKRKQTKFESLCEQFLKHAKAENAAATFQKYEAAIRLYIRPKFEGLWIEEINRYMVDDFKADLSNGKRKDGTKRFIFCTFKTILRKAVDWDLLVKSPAQSVKSPRMGIPRIEYWNEAEVRRFLNTVSGAPRFPLYFIALNTGMRLGEILGLKWDCIDLENKLITVRRTYDQKTNQVKETTKTHKSRPISMNAVVFEFFVRLHKERKDDFVLDRERMRVLNASHVAREFRSDCEMAGVRTIHFHDLRHTYATQFMGKGGSIHALAGVLGHSSTAMTARYAHFTPEHVRQAAEIVSFGITEGGEVVSLALARSQRRVSGHKLVTEL